MLTNPIHFGVRGNEGGGWRVVLVRFLGNCLSIGWFFCWEAVGETENWKPKNQKPSNIVSQFAIGVPQWDSAGDSLGGLEVGSPWSNTVTVIVHNRICSFCCSFLFYFEIPSPCRSLDLFFNCLSPPDHHPLLCSHELSTCSLVLCQFPLFIETEPANPLALGFLPWELCFRHCASLWRFLCRAIPALELLLIGFFLFSVTLCSGLLILSFLSGAILCWQGFFFFTRDYLFLLFLQWLISLLLFTEILLNVSLCV